MKNGAKKGIFISFEKTRDGLGGTTQARALAARLQAQSYDVVSTREPGGTELGTTLREILLQYKGDLSAASELMLFQADRAQHYKNVIKPALKAGKIVICDRFVDSTIAYQGYGRGWSIPTLLKLHEIVTGGLYPDVTFVLDGVSSFKAPGNGDRFENLSEGFFTRVRNGMLQQASLNDRYVILNANRPINVISCQIDQALRTRLGLRLI